MKQENPNGRSSFWFSKTGAVFIGFLAIAAYFLWTEHRAHVIEALPWLLVGACLVMHLFMHHGHGGHHGGDDPDHKGDGQ